MSEAVAFVLPPLVFALGLFLTRRLLSDDPLDHPLPAGAATRSSVPLLVTLVVYGAMIVWWIRTSDPLAIQCLALTCILTLAWTTARLSRDRRAARTIVAENVTPLAILILVFVLMVEGAASRAQTLAMLGASVCLLTAFALAAWLGREAARFRWSYIASILCFAALLLTTLPAALTPRTVTLERAADWVDTFEAPVHASLDWEAMGRAARWIRSEGLGGIAGDTPSHLARKAIRRNGQLHPKTLTAAIDAGLLTKVDLLPLVDSDECRRARRMVSEPWWGFDEAHAAAGVRLLLGLDVLRHVQRERLVERLVESLPPADDPNRRGGIRRLEWAHDACIMLDLLGARARIQERRAALHAMLRRSYCQGAPEYGHAGGFSPYDDWETHASDPEATWMALEIMRYVDVPDGVDLDRTAEYLVEACRPSRRYGVKAPLTSSRRNAHLAWLRLRTDHDVVRPNRYEAAAYGAPLSILLFALFALIVMGRSPEAEIRRVPRDTRRRRRRLEHPTLPGSMPT